MNIEHHLSSLICGVLHLKQREERSRLNAVINIWGIPGLSSVPVQETSRFLELEGEKKSVTFWLRLKMKRFWCEHAWTAL